MKEKKTYIQPLMEEYPLLLATAVCSGGGGKSVLPPPSGTGGTEPTPLNNAPMKAF